MAKEMLFASREDLRAWLHAHCLSDEGIWLVLGKPGGPKTVTAQEVLEEALCFGWIDGQMKSIGENRGSQAGGTLQTQAAPRGYPGACAAVYRKGRGV